MSARPPRCPTCGDEDTTRRGPPLVMGPMQSYSRCPNPWHGEGDGLSATCPECGYHAGAHSESCSQEEA